MQLIVFTNTLLGAFTGIATYRQQNVDYKLLVAYFTVVTPIQLIKTYNGLDLLTKIRLQGVKSYIHIPTTVSMITVGNGAVFGIGYIVGRTAYSALY